LGLRVINAYIDGELQYVTLSKEIKVLEADAIIVDKIKLKEALEKTQVKYPETIGVTVAKNVLIRYLAPNDKGVRKFEGIIWSQRAKLAGSYTIQ